jgi:hypothetical protein
MGEQIPIAGTPFTLNYRSDRVPGRTSAYTLTLPITEKRRAKREPEKREPEGEKRTGGKKENRKKRTGRYVSRDLGRAATAGRGGEREQFVRGEARVHRIAPPCSRSRGANRHRTNVRRRRGFRVAVSPAMYRV